MEWVHVGWKPRGIENGKIMVAVAGWEAAEAKEAGRRVYCHSEAHPEWHRIEEPALP